MTTTDSHGNAWTLTVQTVPAGHASPTALPSL